MAVRNIGLATLAIMGLGLLSVPARADDNWNGRLRCDTMPGHTDGKLNAPLTISQSDRTLRYSRPMGISSGGFTNQAETGTGTIDGNKVDLTGSYSEQGSSNAAHYFGQIRDGRMILTGEQVWTFRRNQEVVHRPCTATLQR